MTPINVKEENSGLRNVADLLRGPRTSLYKTGRDYSIAKCKLLYDASKLAKLPKEEQNKLVSEHYPKKEILGYFKLWLIDFIQSVNVKNTLTEIQIDFIAETMFRDHSWSEKDLYLFFRNIKSGIYGQFYESLSPEKIIEWSELYWYDRAGVAETLNNHEVHFDPLKHKMDPKLFKAMFEGVGEPEKEPEVIRKKHDTFLDSEKGFRAYLANITNEANEEQLLSLIGSWRMQSSLKQYVDIFTSELIKISPKYQEYHDCVTRLLVLQENFSKGDTTLLGDIEELTKIIIKFEGK